MTVKGIDIASYQSATYATEGLAFVVVKCTEGTDYVNPKYTAQVAHARAESLVVGHYHFVRPGNMAAQLAHFLAHADIRPGDFVGFDWEDTGVSGADKDTWIKAAQGKQPGQRVILYCNRDFWLNRDHTSFCGDGLWIADPDVTAGHPRVQHAWTFHQYSSSGGIDHDLGNFASKAALQAWAAKGAPPKPPVPKPPTPKPPVKPHVDLSNLIAAAKADPKAKQGHTTHAADVRLVEAALRAEGLLASKYAGDGSFGTTTLTAYAAWQRHLGYKGADANGIPGKASLTKLGAQHGFTVVA
jgi:hypothetical protein